MSNEAAVANNRSLTLGAAAGSLGYLALGLTLLAYGVVSTGVIHNTTVADTHALTLWVGGVALAICGLVEFRAGSAATGTAFAGLGALWVVASQASPSSANAAGLFYVIWALLALALTASQWRDGSMLLRGVHGLFTVALVLWAIGSFAGNSGLDKTAGWVAAVAGLLSWYAATVSLGGSSWAGLSLPVR
ncbi:GPR1/FUN34/YaaH family transporter [Streptacidiphilus neutrinimicus]|uniref:GPR1/FUN34/YaaH family transporter n=1 Tax=Streptacidiphilus neutrinimicus TaxID=105420 RepID=UPI000A051AD1|nr:GPR1/FUN34/YaaH family transporter [Streptacidiphilus neutrinimicus]